MGCRQTRARVAVRVARKLVTIIVDRESSLPPLETPQGNPEILAASAAAFSGAADVNLLTLVVAGRVHGWLVPKTAR